MRNTIGILVLGLLGGCVSVELGKPDMAIAEYKYVCDWGPSEAPNDYGIRELDPAGVAALDYESLSPVEVAVCQRPWKVVQESPAPPKLWRVTADLGANAITGVDCGKTDELSWRKNCTYGYFFCSAEALRVDGDLK